MPYTTIDDFVNNSFDYVIVGGGTAGLVLAARLSEKKSISVGVIEAGVSRLGDPKVDLPTGAALMLGNEDYDWNFKSVPQVRFSPCPVMCLLTRFLLPGSEQG
jgi:choline dehydrogenase-like flavoprotein